MAKLQRLSWESVSAIAHPDCYNGAGPRVGRDEVPEHYWSFVQTQPRESVAEQFAGLQKLVERGELIRNVRRYEGEVPDINWTDTTPQDG